MERKWDTVGDHDTFEAAAWGADDENGYQFDAVGGIEDGGGHAELWITPLRAESGMNTSITWRVQARGSGARSRRAISARDLGDGLTPQVHVCPRYSMAYVDTPDISKWGTCQSCAIGEGNSRVMLGPMDSIAYDRLCDGVDPPTEDDGDTTLVIFIEGARAGDLRRSRRRVAART